MPLADDRRDYRDQWHAFERGHVQPQIPQARFPPPGANLGIVPQAGACVAAECLTPEVVIEPGTARRVGFDLGQPPRGIGLRTERGRRVLYLPGRRDEKAWYVPMGSLRICSRPRRSTLASDLARQTHWRLSGWTGNPGRHI